VLLAPLQARVAQIKINHHIRTTNFSIAFH
jgi:hypothetical protein